VLEGRTRYQWSFVKNLNPLDSGNRMYLFQQTKIFLFQSSLNKISFSKVRDSIARDSSRTADRFFASQVGPARKEQSSTQSHQPKQTGMF
jgi:hypothetical protein